LESKGFPKKEGFMQYALCIILSLLIVNMPIKLAAWTCVCGKTEEGENPVLRDIFSNFRMCHLDYQFQSRVQVSCYNNSKWGEVDWWIDIRHKQSALGNFYLKYELVHKRYDPFDRYSVFQAFNILNFNEHARIFREFLFDVDWVYSSNIEFEQRMLIKDKEKLNAASSRMEIISAENQVYKRWMGILDLQKARTNWLKRLKERRKEDEGLMMQLFDNCLRTHFSVIPKYQKGLFDFLKGEFKKAFDQMEEFISLLVEKKIESIASDTAALLCGIVASEVEEYALAESCLNCSIEKNPDCIQAYLERAVVRLQLGSFDGALQDYRLSGLHSLFLDTQSQFISKKRLADGIVAGFRDSCEIVEDDAALLSNFFTELVDCKVQYLSEGMKSSLEFLSEIILSIEDAIQNHMQEIADIKISELVYLMQNYDKLDDFQRGRLIGKIIKKYDIDAFSKRSCIQAVDFFRDVKKIDSLLKLEELLESKNDSQ
jgi:hypothetical protein